jgi:prepilin-type N-terminal cleavage/methylation domain-containing protein
MSQKTCSRSIGGYTLIEVLVSMLVSGIIVIFVTQFFKDSHRAYNIQELLGDRDQNAEYVLKRLGDRFMEAGANLPGEGFPIIVPNRSQPTDFSMVINPRGGMQAFYEDLVSTQDIPVDNANAFNTAHALLVVHADKSKPVETIDIATTYSDNGFENGLKAAMGVQNFIRVANPRDFKSGDAIYAFSQEDYSLAHTQLLLGNMVLAENIESLDLGFLDSTGMPTTNWQNMHSATLSVTARTRRPDPGYPGDGYRRITLNSEVRLRNRP